MNEAQIEREISDLFQHTWTYPELLRVHTRAVRLAETVFGATSEEVASLKALRVLYEISAQSSDGQTAHEEWRQAIHGFLNDFKAYISNGGLTRLRLTMQGEVLADFLKLSKQFLDDGQVTVAAVLAAAGLEDAMKRCAQNAGITLPPKSDLSTAANALISKRVIDGAEKAMVQGLFPFRNDALHANWSRVTDNAVQSAIGFLQGFLQKHF